MGVPIRHFGLILVVVMGVYMCYDAHFRYIANDIKIELNAGGETNLNSYGSHSDLFDEDQVWMVVGFAKPMAMAVAPGFSGVVCRETRQFFVIWQPPKIN